MFLMRVTADSCFDKYWEAEEFFKKRAVMNGSLEQRFGDNIYHRDENEQWIQEDSRHSYDQDANQRNLKRDTGTTARILLSTDFIYWGEKAPALPQSLSKFAIGRRGQSDKFSEAEVDSLVDWAMGMGDRGLVGDPLEWNYERWWR